MAIALVSHVAKTTSGTTAGIDTTGATFLVVAVGYISTGASSGTPVLSDSNSNTWVRIANGLVANASVDLQVCLNPTVGAGHTFTVSAAGAPSFCVAAFSGTATDFQCGRAVNNSTASGTSVQPGSVTPTRDNCALVAALAYRDTTTVSVNSSFTITDQNPFASGIAIGCVLAYRVETTATAVNPTFSWTNAVGATAMQIEVQPPPTGGGGGGGAWAFA